MSDPTVSATPPPAPGSWQSEVRGFLRVTSTLALVWILLTGLLALVFLVVFVIDLLHLAGADAFVSFVYWGASAFVSFLIFGETKTWLEQAHLGQYALVRQGILLWAILGLIFGLVLGLLLILIYVRLARVGSGFYWGTESQSQPPPQSQGTAAPPPLPPSPPPPPRPRRAHRLRSDFQ